MGGKACIIVLAAASFAVSAPAVAGVVDGVRTVDDVTVYLGVVPAGLVRGHKAELNAAVHAGLPPSSIHNVHLLAAVFNKDSGVRLRNIRVVARLRGMGRTRWTVQLRPMVVNQALTYGAFTNLGDQQRVMIAIDVIRPDRKNVTTAQFDYVHD